MTYRPDIDGLRALAVVLVLGFHAFPHRVPGGFVGVDVFFVISGFLITRLLRDRLGRGEFSIAEFYARRSRRILPALCVVLAACFVVGWFRLLPADFAQLGRQIAGSAAFVPNLILWRDVGYFDQAAESKPLLHLWSLGIEEQFYLVWPLLLLAIHRLGRGGAGFSLACTLALALVSLGLDQHAVAHLDLGGAFYLPQNRIWELLVGAALAQIPVRLGRLPALAGSAVGLALIAWSAWVLDAETPFPGAAALAPVLGAALVIAAGETTWINRRMLSGRALVGVGLVSYPLYLWHWPLLTFARTLGPSPPGAATTLALLGAAFVLSVLTYRWIETPIRHGGDGRRKVVGLVGALAGIGTLGLWAYLGNGLAFRLPELVRQIANPPEVAVDADYRPRTCFLQLGQSPAQFKDCADGRDPGKPTLFLWGDSHAAHLYPGIAKVFGPHYNVMQRTMAACPPVLEFRWALSRRCAEDNAGLLADIARVRPDRLVIAGAWLGGYRLDEKMELVEATLREVQKLGLPHVELVGPDPYWRGGLPKTLYQAYLSDPAHRIPERLATGIDARRRRQDAALAELARRYGMEYVSPLQILCNDEGCLTRVGDGPGSLVTWDEEHLSSAGSEYVVERFPSARALGER